MNIELKNLIKKFLYWLPTIIFNIVETIIIFIVGMLIDISIFKIIYGITIFQVVRHTIKQDRHYKNPFKCLISTTLVFASIFLIAKINMLFYSVASIFAAYILSGKADINIENEEKCNNIGMYLWKKKSEPSKYKMIEEYVEENKDTKQIMEFEKILKDINEEYYKIYKLRFYEGKSQKYIVEKMQINSTARLTEKLDDIKNALEFYLKVNKKELISKN